MEFISQNIPYMAAAPAMKPVARALPATAKYPANSLSPIASPRLLDDARRDLHRPAEVRLGGGRSAQAIFLRESRRSPLPVVPLAGGTAILWDGRFRIALEGGRESVQIKGGVTETSGTGGCGKARQSLPLAVRNGVEVASPLDVPGARAAGLTFEFVGGRTIFRDRARAETQK